MLSFFISSFAQFLTYSDTLAVAVCSTAVLLCSLAHKILRGGHT